MGKPFHNELSQLWDTYYWSIRQSVEEISQDLLHYNKKPLFIVGSGGSLSVCHYIAALYQQHGMMAKAITPLELYYSRHALRESNVLFISASGKNTDILFGYKTAVSYEPNRIYSLCMKKNSPLSKLAATVSIAKHFDFNLPSGKDGFLATNSLVSFFALSNKIFAGADEVLSPVDNERDLFSAEIRKFFQTVSQEYTFSVLHGGWGTPVAVDLESKMAEAALGDILIADYRNFGHGRHHWFDKRGEKSAMIALITPQEADIAKKTLALLPKEIPILQIRSDRRTSDASIELLIKSFYVIEQLGNIQGIDPGRPGVPDYGRKLYHLNYQKIYEAKDLTPKKTAIIRKADIPTWEALTNAEQNFWEEAYNGFFAKLRQARFGTAIFDYDGTLCSAKNRYKGIDDKIAESLNHLLQSGFVMGIATGRGRSVKETLRNAIAEKHWPQVLVGYYNCGEVIALSNPAGPDKERNPNPALLQIFKRLQQYPFPVEILPELKPNQLVIEIKEKSEWAKIRLIIIQLVINMNIPGIQILESSHSMDIIDQAETNKLNIIARCVEEARRRGLAEEVICFGDKGKWPGNDYQLLSTPYSLSVDEVSALPDSCWNVAPPGIKNTEAMLYYLSAHQFSGTYFQINL